MKKRFTALFLTFALVFALLPAAVLTASAETYSGTCGDNLIWTLDTETGVLTISGSGPMDNYDFVHEKSPWAWMYVAGTPSDVIKSIHIESGVTTVGSWAFYDVGINAEIDVSLPNTVTSICDGAFFGCKLKSITIPDSVTSIGDSAFSKCAGLTSVTIPGSVTSIGQYAFGYYYESYQKVDGFTIYGYEGTAAETYANDNGFAFIALVMEKPQGYCGGEGGGRNLTWTLDSGAGVLIISGSGIMADYAPRSSPWYAKTFKTVIIQNGVTSIGAYAFYEKITLTSVTIGNSVTSIGDYAFDRCSALTSLTIPDSVKSIYFSPFDECFSLTRINVSAGNPSYSSLDGVLFDRNKANLIRYPQGKPEETYNIPDSVQNIDTGAFLDCSSLVSVTIPDSVTGIKNHAFYGCDHLTGVAIGKSVTSIGNRAFMGCPLTSVTIPDSVTSIGEEAFEGDPLTSVIIGNGVTSIDICAFMGCSHLTSVTIGNNVTSIGAAAFCDCTSLTSVTIPNSVTSIGERAFGYYWSSEKPNGKVKGFTIYGYAGSAAENYAKDNGFPFISLGEAPIDRFDPDTDRWGFANSSSVFGKREEGYEITQPDYDRLLSNLKPADRNAIEYTNGLKNTGYDTILKNYHVIGSADQDYRDWNGSCYGMSTSAITMFRRVLKPGDLAASANNLIDVPFSKQTESLINFYHHQQRLPQLQPIVAEFMSMPQSQQLLQLRNMVEACKDGDGPVLVRYQWYKAFLEDGTPDTESHAGHTVVAYAASDLSSPRTYQGYQFNHMISIYDCAYPEQKEERSLYYNDDGIWCIPGWNVISTSSASRSSPGNNGQLKLVTNDISLINVIDYKTGAVSLPSTSRTILYTNVEKSYQLAWNGKTADVHGFSVDEDSGIQIILFDNITADGETTGSAAAAVLPDADGYRVDSQTDSLQFMLYKGNAAYTADADAAGTAEFRNEGVSMHLNSAAGCAASISADDLGASYETVSAACENATELSISLQSEGVVIFGNDLHNLTVSGCDEADEPIFNRIISTDAQSVLVSDSQGKVVVKADEDGDGVHETVLPDNFFTDVPLGTWYTAPTIWAVRNKITLGTSETTFSPNAGCTRAQVVTFLWRAAGSPEPAATNNPFKDVKESEYYYKAVLWAVEKKITVGTAADRFSPNVTCTRAQIVTFLWRFEGNPDPATTDNPFKDVKPDAYYKKAVLWAAETGVTNGTSASTFSPDDTCTRAQVVTFLYRGIKK